jgi:hypothetical protein
MYFPDAWQFENGAVMSAISLLGLAAGMSGARLRAVLGSIDRVALCGSVSNLLLGFGWVVVLIFGLCRADTNCLSFLHLQYWPML